MSSRFAALHLQNIVVLLPAGRNSPCFVTRFCSLHRHLGALATLPLAGARVQFFISAKQKDTIRCPFVLAEGVKRKLNVASPALDDLELVEFDPPE